MFTKVDYERYFSAIKNADEKMLENIQELIAEVSDANVLKVLNHIKEDEQKHVTLSDELFSLLPKEEVVGTA